MSRFLSIYTVSHLAAGSPLQPARRQPDATPRTVLRPMLRTTLRTTGRRQAREVCRFCTVMRRLTALILVIVVGLLIGLQESGLLSGSNDNANAVEPHISPSDHLQ